MEHGIPALDLLLLNFYQDELPSERLDYYAWF